MGATNIRKMVSTMPDREIVIKGLECAIDPDHGGFKGCHSCEYRKDVDHLQWVCDGDRCIADALKLLKAQEPRVMTHYDMENVEPGNVVWCEQRDEVRTYLTPLIRYDDIFENRWLGVEPQAVFLPNIRFWTSRPDEKRRAETPWN